MTELYLIKGGSDLSDADKTAAIAAIPFEALMDHVAAAQFAARAEGDARMAAGLVSPGAAILAKSKSQLASMIAACDPGEADEALQAFKAGIAAALVQLAVLRAAESRLLIATTTAAAQPSVPASVYIP